MKKSISHRIALSLPLLVLLLAFADPSCVAASEAFQRWAVVGDAASRESGLSDLVHAELAEHSKIELVEREELQLAIRELELSSLHTALQSGQRLQLGALVKADALLLLSSGTHAGQPFVRVVTCDCASGARLAYEQYSSSELKIDELAIRISVVVFQTLARFPAGVQRLVTVSPFISKDFLHDFDHLQNSCSAWLSEVLSQQPGLAVLELEEARAIGRELSITGQQLSERQRPLFISGEYLSKRHADSEASEFQVSVSARDNEKVIATLDSGWLSLPTIPEWLESTTGSAVLKQLKQRRSETRSISRTEQVRLLSERAERFSQFGAYTQSIPLREASLLLKSDSVEELALVRNYQSLLKNRYDEASFWIAERHRVAVRSGGTENYKFPETWEQRFEGDLKLYTAMLPHCVRILSDATVSDRFINDTFNAMYRKLPDCRFVPHRWAEAHGHREATFWTAVSRLSSSIKLAYHETAGLQAVQQRHSARNEIMLKRERLLSTAIHYVFTFRGRVALPGPRHEWQAEDSLEAFAKLLQETDMAGCPSVQVTRVCVGGLGDCLMDYLKYGAFKKPQLLAFRDSLIESGDPIRVLYGECLDSNIRWQSLAEKTDEFRTRRLNELANFESLILRWRKENSEHASSTWPVVANLRNLKRNLENMSIGAGQKWPSTPRPVTGASPFPHLRFQRTKIAADWSHLTRCTSEFDIVWSFERVAKLTADGRQTVLYDAKKQKDQVRHVVWDGKFLWLGTRTFGVRLLTPEGKVLEEIPQGDEGTAKAPRLPEWEPDNMGDGMTARVESTSQQHAFRLFGVSPGRCLVTGRYGKQDRLWISLIEFKDNHCDVHVLHEAAFRADNNVHRDPGIKEACEPKWFLHVPPSPGKTVSQVLMGRGLINHYAAIRQPMLIDVVSKRVSLLDGEPPLPGTGPIRLTTPMKSSAIIQDINGFNLLSPDTTAASGWSSRLIKFQKEDSVRHRSYAWPLTAGDTVYFPGPIWRRLDMNSGSLQQVTPEPLSTEWLFDEYAASGPLGLVAWNRGDSLNRVTVSSDPTRQPTVEERYPFVLSDQRASHHKAVVRLRKLGATVESRWGSFTRSVFQRRNGKEWLTAVWIPESWKGNSSDFALVKDLYNVRELLLVGAPITDSDCETIGQLTQLQHLTFEQTNVTNRGLMSLRSLPHLAELRLQSRPTDHSFSDNAMTALSKLPSIERLIFHGKGFTDAAVGNLPATRRFHRLCLLDTAISDQAMATAALTVRNLRVKRHMFYNRP